MAKGTISEFSRNQRCIYYQEKVLADAGYRGLQKIHKNVKLPHRKTKKNPLSKDKRKENRESASQRVIVENVIGLLKRFKIIADR